MIYLDTSAFTKTIVDEPQSAALQTYLEQLGTARFVSSSLLVIEARRAALRNHSTRLPRVDLALARIQQIDISAAVIETASRLPEPMLRSLDAIHLATALTVRGDLQALLSYDQRLLAAAAAHGLPTAAPA